VITTLTIKSPHLRIVSAMAEGVAFALAGFGFGLALDRGDLIFVAVF